MPSVSQKKKDKIIEQILHYLFSTSPEPKFTSEIAGELARDEEFIKSLLQELHKKKLIILVNKNKSGLEYKKRQRWLLSSDVYTIYSKKQSK